MRRLVCSHHLIEFVGDALHRNYLNAFTVAGDGFFGLLLYTKTQPARKPDGAQHPQRVVRKGCIGFQWRADDAVVEVVDAVERVGEFAKISLVHRNAHRVDGEVAAFLVVLDSAVFNNRLARIAVVGFLARPHKFEFASLVTQHRRAKIPVNHHVALATEVFAHFLRKLDAAARHHKVDVLAWDAEQQIPHKTTYNVCLQAGTLRHEGDVPKNRIVQLVLQISHNCQLSK